MNILYHLTGVVEHGAGKGQTVGMPTANLCITPDMVLPPPGVYATRVAWSGARYVAVTNVGTRPSVDASPKVTVETLLLDFSGDLYGEEITVDFLAFIRPVMQFASLAEVRQQVERDVEVARGYAGAGDAGGYSPPDPSAGK